MVASALAAGIPEEQLRKLAAISNKTNKMQDFPNTRAKAGYDILGESAEEGEEDAEEEEGAEAAEAKGSEEVSSPPIEKAVLQLTKLVGHMAKQSQKDLETLLDGADGGSADITTSGGGKSKAAAFQKLRSALRDNPIFIYQSIEARMQEDFDQVRSAPGVSQKEVSSRAWAEHRSKVTNFPSAVRAIWTIAAIHDCIKSGAYAEARSRACLALAAWDQAFCWRSRLLIRASPSIACRRVGSRRQRSSSTRGG